MKQSATQLEEQRAQVKELRKRLDETAGTVMETGRPDLIEWLERDRARLADLERQLGIDTGERKGS